MKRFLVLMILLFGFVSTVDAQHSVDLSWQDSTSGVTFNIYRAPCNGTVSAGVCSQEGSFQNLANVSELTYTDTAVTAGAAYSWYATALDSGGDESVASNHFAAVIPGGSGRWGLGDPGNCCKGRRWGDHTANGYRCDS
jgi:hypothetical protein